MISSVRFRALAVAAVAGLVAATFVAPPAEAGKKKKKKPACAAYQPGEFAADAELTKITDKATEEAPIELELDTEPGLGFSSSDEPEGGTPFPSSVYQNIQIDSKAANAGLFVRVEFGAAWDYDLFQRLADGSSVAFAAGFNQAPVGPGLDGTGNGGHSEIGAEALDGVLVADCDGYSLEIVSAVAPGGPVTVKLWLGEPAS